LLDGVRAGDGPQNAHSPLSYWADQVRAEWTRDE
jgi:hypothetical protein